MHSICPIEFIDWRKSQHESGSIALTIVLASAGEEACKCSYEKVRLVGTYLSQNDHKHTEKVIENLALPLQKFRRFYDNIYPTSP